MTFEEMLEQVPNEDLRKSMKEEFSRVNKEAGERGRKLIEKDSELTTLKTERKQKSEYETAFNLLKAKGVGAQDIPGILEKMEVNKTAEDELRLMTGLYKDAKDKVDGFEKQVRGHKLQTAMDSVFDEMRKSLKDDKGQPIVVIDEFIDKAKLYADVSDPENKVLLEQRAKEVLTLGLQKQESIKSKFGFQGAQTFTVPEGNSNPGGNNNIASSLKEVAQKHGPAAALADWYRMQGI